MSKPAIRLRGVRKVFPGARGRDPLVAVASLDLDLRPGEFFTFLGPSGCGKTTLLRMIAGFEEPTAGDIAIAGQPMRGVPPNRRPVNLVFQSYALFPHLDVAANVGFSLAMQGLAEAAIADRVAEALAMVRLEDMEDRLPAQLSGGQQQRVALARAIIGRPAVLLLDEPLGALDLKLRKAMQLELKRLQARLGMTFVYITHDQEEALTMSDRVAVMRAGVVEQLGTPREIYERPASRFVADFIGESNFLEAVVTSVAEDHAMVEALDGGISLRLDPAAAAGAATGDRVTLTLRPEQLDLCLADLGYDDDPHTADGLFGTIEDVVYIGTDLRCVVRLTGYPSPDAAAAITRGPPGWCACPGTPTGPIRAWRRARWSV
ncbi:MAG: polyamine ABC transporter ATP-binding protein [Ardenticatenia bacterium]|nr:polyamine ABC transporter ATP-binding protein [Ardenticatenia bacterium]